MDEPLAHVSPAAEAALWEVVRARVQRMGAAWVFSTHRPRWAAACAEHAVVLDAGQVAYAGPMRELEERPATPALAYALGEANWFEPGDAAQWLGAEAERGFAVRPRALGLRAAVDGRCVMFACSAGESNWRVELRSDAGAKGVFLVTRAVGAAWPAVGDRVELVWEGPTGPGGAYAR
jgi:hypothetical protein